MGNFDASGVVSSAVGGIASLIGQRRTNKTNLKIARETNEANKEIAQMSNEWNAREAALNRQWQESQTDKQNQWNLEQWNRENEYNSAAAQRERLEQAGLNPALAMQGAGAGTASSIQSAPAGSGAQASATTPTMVAPQVSYDYTGVADAINSFYQNKKMLADTKGIETRTKSDAVDLGFKLQYGDDLQRAMIASAIDGRYELLTDKYKKGRQNMALPLLGSNTTADLMQSQVVKSQAASNFASAMNNFMSAQGQAILNEYLPQQQQAEYYLKLSNIMLQNTEMRKKEQEIQNLVATMLEINARTNGIKLDNKAKSSLFAWTMKAAKQELEYNYEFYKGMKENAFKLAQGRNTLELSTLEALKARASDDLDYLDYRARIDKLFFGGNKIARYAARSLFEDYIPVRDLINILK